MGTSINDSMALEGGVKDFCDDGTKSLVVCSSKKRDNGGGGSKKGRSC